MVFNSYSELRTAMKRISTYKLLAVCMAAVVLLLLAANFLFSGSSSDVAYHTEEVDRGGIEVNVNGVGDVGAAQLVTVGAQVSGKIEKIYVKLGDYVQKDDIIAEIDDTTQISELETRKARLQTYKAQLVNHSVAAEIATAQYERESNLYAQKSTAQQDLETAKKAYAQANADLEATKSLIIQEEVAIAKAEADLGYTRIVAPMSGTIISLPVEAGQTVNANQTTPTIALLADLSRMEIKVQISEGDITKVAQGMPVSFYILSEPETGFSSTLNSIDPGYIALTDDYNGGRSSSSSDGAVYYYARMLVDNPDGKLRIGMTAHCTIAVAGVKDVLRVPSVAVRERDGRVYVRVLSGGKPEKRYIETGLSNSLYTEVKSGLSQGEKVITAQMSQAEIDEQIKKRRR